ncbi:MAG: DUF695 domain-containing protein [Christensenellaceae bacterium]|jgi:hypothetical protein|nr:DUF695 domain-containing protein [Christensenellaceae bacterium]
MKESNTPEKGFSVIRYINNNMPAVGIVNIPLLETKLKGAFTYALSLSIEFKDTNKDGMPSQEELPEIDAFCDKLDEQLVGGDPAHPKVLLLARITWNGARDLFYRVTDPETVHAYLQSLIKQENFPIKFDYLMEFDKKWKTTDWIRKLVKKRK